MGSGGINRKDFGKWTRWYQEDGNTQVFRLFKGEQNVRGGADKDGSPGRVESFSRPLTAAPGTWREWEGTYTVIEPVDACIFQLMHEGSLWPFHIRVRDHGHDFEVYLDGKQVGTGSWPRPEGDTGFRWGMYLGAQPVRHEAMLFVTGVAIQ
jgi:hypothetical protein